MLLFRFCRFEESLTALVALTTLQPCRQNREDEMDMDFKQCDRSLSVYFCMFPMTTKLSLLTVQEH